ncbi:MAG TPA: HEAT repeat domain-containing protein [Phototrophicaceae bacterium]|jgi:HEAT repeat protein|nr:HEAT repeat domain-containing protein [Phototrophicaceae bacterium]
MARLLRPLAMIVLAAISFVMIRLQSRKKSAVVKPIEEVQLPANALKHADWRVRQAAIKQAMQASGEERLKQLLTGMEDTDEDVRNTAAGLITGLGEESVSGLLALLRDGAVNTRALAASTLGQINSKQALDGLTAALSDESMWVRTPAAQALGKLGNAAVPALKTVLQDGDKDVREAAKQALEMIDTPAAKAALKANQDVKKGGKVVEAE